jgi:hypothetical protein
MQAAERSLNSGMYQGIVLDSVRISETASDLPEAVSGAPGAVSEFSQAAAEMSESVTSVIPATAVTNFI